MLGLACISMTRTRRGLRAPPRKLFNLVCLSIKKKKAIGFFRDNNKIIIKGNSYFCGQGKSKQILAKHYNIGIADADLLDGGTRHPNLALLKIAGFLHDNNIEFHLIEDSNADVSGFDYIYMSKVFTFTRDPLFLSQCHLTKKPRIRMGGTGGYATEKNILKFRKARGKDMSMLEEDPFLNRFLNHCGGDKVNGIDMARQMPYYHLYDHFVYGKIANGAKRSHYKDYLDYSIGFLTRGCFRHCPFCVNKLEDTITKYSEISWFYDKERPFIYLWDDNFLAAKKEIWKPLLQELIDTGRPFQFRQGLDERIIAEHEDGEEIAEMLSKSKYHGDYIFAFDNWRDRDKIVKALKIWKYYNPKRITKFYLFCGFMLKDGDKEHLYKDIWELFHRIKILMQYGCLGYVMRHADYKNYTTNNLSNIYVQIARWCNQPQFFKKMSFWEYVYRNQSYYEQTSLEMDVPDIKSYEEYVADVEAGEYDGIKTCNTLRTLLNVLTTFPEHKEELLEMFNYKMMDLVDPTLWERK